jgi:hypothetical protein
VTYQIRALDTLVTSRNLWNTPAGTALDKARVHPDWLRVFGKKARTGFALIEQLLEENLRSPSRDLFDRLLNHADRWTNRRGKLKIVKA